MSAFEAVLAAVIIIAALLQVVALFLLYRVISKAAANVNRVIGEIEPELRDLGEGVRSARKAVEVSAAEVRATLTGVRAATDEVKILVQSEGRELSRFVGRVTQTAERQIAEVDEAFSRARERVYELGTGLDRTVLEPVRIAMAVGVGVRRGLEAVFSPRQRWHGDGNGGTGRPGEAGYRSEPGGGRI